MADTKGIPTEGQDNGTKNTKQRQIPAENPSAAKLAEGKKLTVNAEVTAAFYDAIAAWSATRHGTRVIEGVKYLMPDAFSQAVREGLALGVGFAFTSAAELSPSGGSKTTKSAEALNTQVRGQVRELFAKLHGNGLDETMAYDVARSVAGAANVTLDDAALAEIWQAATAA